VDRSRLAPLSALAGCPDEDLDAVARVAAECEFAAGETLMAEGDFGHFKPDVWRLENEAPEAARRLRAAMEEHLARDQPPSAS
jgi:hypothetical protein